LIKISHHYWEVAARARSGANTCRREVGQKKSWPYGCSSWPLCQGRELFWRRGGL